MGIAHLLLQLPAENAPRQQLHLARVASSWKYKTLSIIEIISCYNSNSS
jgi:hypothetical protein